MNRWSSPRRLVVLLVVLLVDGPLAWSASDDPLLAFPTLPKPVPLAAAELPLRTGLAPGIAIVAGTAVVLGGVCNIDQGPPDGLEVLACLAGGKQHEALIRLDTADGAVVKAACIAALGLDQDGVPALEASGQPARGWPLAVTVRWSAGGVTVAMAASSLIRDRITDQPYPPLPWVYTGSRFQDLVQTAADGQIQQRRTFMLDVSKSVAVNYDEPDTLLASPFPGARSDQRFEVYSGAAPHAGTPIELVLERCALPLTLVAERDGALRDAVGSAVLDDAAVGQRLARHYGPGTTPAWRAMVVQIPADAPRDLDAIVHQRILRLAAEAKAWVVALSMPRSGP